MMPPILLAALITTTSWGLDIPEGTEISVRGNVGAIAPGIRNVWREAEPILSLQPSLRDSIRNLVYDVEATLKDVARLTGADAEQSGVTAVVNLDLDAEGGAVVSCILRGGTPGQGASGGKKAFEVDGHPVSCDSVRGRCWAKLSGGAVVVGNERGLKRQLRRSLQHSVGRLTELGRRAGRLDPAAEVNLVFSLPMSTRTAVVKDFAEAGVALGLFHSGSVSFFDTRIVAHLVADSAEQQEGAEHFLRSLVAFLKSGVVLTEGGAELLLAFESLGHRPRSLPQALTRERLDGLLKNWLAGFELDGEVFRRSHSETEILLQFSGYRGLVASTLLGATVFKRRLLKDSAADVRSTLQALRGAQLRYRSRYGRFMPCGPVPAFYPHEPIPWPADTCFQELGFAPVGPVDFQLAATVNDGQLVLIARSDPDRDGVPGVWYLDETSDVVRSFGVSRH